MIGLRMTARGALLPSLDVPTVAYETSIRVNRAYSLDMFGLDHPVACALSAMAGPRLRLLMQCYPTGNQENACGLDRRRYLMQDQDPNQGGRGWQ